MNGPARWTAGVVVVGAIVALGAAVVWSGPAVPASTSSASTLAKATFAGGCFWCMEPPFDALDGVVSTTSGYIGGRLANPTYEQVSSGGTGHTEAVQVIYDPSRISYDRLLEVFWHNVDPLTANGQFCDRGEQYRTGIFWHDEDQQRRAEQSKRAVALRLGRTVVTEITRAGVFYAAEEYHQDYYRKNPVRYRFYRGNCGRDRRLQEIWGPDAPSH